MGISRQSSCPQPTAQGWHTQKASACPTGHQAAGSQTCCLPPPPTSAHEEVSPAESQALCPRLNKIDLGCKVLGWEKPELLGEASNEKPHPAVPALGRGPLTTQNVTAVTAAQHPWMWVQPLGEPSPGKGQQNNLPLEKWNLKEFWLKRAHQTYWANDQLFLVVPFRFMNSKQQAKQSMNILDMVLTLPTLFSILAYF